MSLSHQINRSTICLIPIAKSVGISLIALFSNISLGIYCYKSGMIIEHGYLKYGLLYLLFPILWVFIATIIGRMYILQNAYGKWIKPELSNWLEQMFSAKTGTLSNMSQIESFIHLKVRETSTSFQIKWVEDELFSYIAKFKWKQHVPEMQLKDKALGKLEYELEDYIRQKLTIKTVPLYLCLGLNLITFLAVIFL